MEEKIVKYGVAGFLALVVLMLSGLYCLPNVEAYVDKKMEALRLERELREERIMALDAMSGLDFLAFMTEQANGRRNIIHIDEITDGILAASGELENEETAEEITFSSQLRMELPTRASFSDISVETDYLRHLVTLTIAKANEDYLIDHPMIGSTGNIKNLSFDNRAQGFLIQFAFAESMECILTPDAENDRYVYVDFITPRARYEKIVVIDAGHGGESGAVQQGYMEKDINLSIVLKLKELLDAADPSIGIYYTRLTDEEVALQDRSALANELGADLFLSIHCNSYNLQESVRGTQVLYDFGEEPAVGSEAFAKRLLSNTIASLGTKDMGVIDGSGLYILRTATMRAVMLEVAFMTNETDLKNLVDEEFQQKCAQAVYDTIMEELAI